MAGTPFYNTSSDKSVPVYFIKKTDWHSNAITLDTAVKRTLDLYDFNGECQDMVLILDSESNVKAVYSGVEDNNYSLALANVAIKAPEGIYSLTESLPVDVLISWGLAQYKFASYKTKKIETKPRVLIVDEVSYTKILPLVDAVSIARDLINQPANVCNPEYLTDYAKQFSKKYKGKFEKWVGSSLLKYNFPAIYTVGKGSFYEPRLLSITFGNSKDPLVTLVGKGVCFDTGGLDIKPAEYMRLMKKDMGGAALVFGLAEWILRSNIPIRLNVLIPVVENSVGSNSYRQGDIITMRNGLTVEIEHTDAEGRLVLADALTKACENSPDLIIDFATLTGAARVAVGTDISLMFANNDKVANEMLESAEKVNDPVVRLPLYKAYEALIKSSVADLANCGSSSYAGAITAALFLQKFIQDTHKWVHFDVMCWNLKTIPGKPEGGEAMAIRAVANYLLQRYC